MRGFRRLLWGAAAALVSALPASAVSMDDMPAPLQKDVACVLDIVKATPGIDDIRVDFSRTNFTTDPVNNWDHPVIQYRVTDKTGNWQYIAFNAERQRAADGYSYG